MELRVLVVDDEEIIRDGIAKKIRRLYPTAAVVGLASDAAEAMDMMARMHPDVVITDISKPEEDGISFIRRARAQYADVCFLILSGHQDFKHAQDAIHLGVDEYLLKPLENELLVAALQRAEQRMEQESRRKMRLTALETRAVIGADLLKGRFLAELLAAVDGEAVSAALSHLRDIGVTLPHGFFTVLVAHLLPMEDEEGVRLEKDMPLLRFSVCNIGCEMLGCLGTVIAGDAARDHHQVTLLVNHASMEMLHGLPAVCRQIQQVMIRHFGVQLSIGIGLAREGTASLSRSADEARMAALQYIVSGGNRVYQYGALPEQTGTRHLISDATRQAFLQAIAEGNGPEALNQLDAAFRVLESAPAQYQDMRRFHADLYLLFDRAVRESGGVWSQAIHEDRFSDEALLQCISLRHLKQRLSTDLAAICTHIAEVRRSEGRKIIERIRIDLEANFHCDVTLADLAERHHLNANYLGQLFKKETGQNYVEYVTGLRMEKARVLLATTQLKTYRIAEMVGYGNARYFYEVFRKCGGLTPTQYRSKMQPDASHEAEGEEP